MAHVLVYYTLLVVIIICIMFVKLRKCWRMLYRAVSLVTPENSTIQKLENVVKSSEFGYTREQHYTKVGECCKEQ